MYDSIGNRVAQGLNGTATGGHWQITTYNHNSLNNELTSSNSNAVTTQYGYDSNGKLLTKNIGPTTHWNYTWNVQGQLLKVANDSGIQGYYAYDGFGRRVESKESNTPIFYYYLGTETLGETGVFPDNDYVYANGLRIAMVNDAAGYHPTVVYYHTDALGSTRLVTSANKSVLFSDSYQPFGQDNNVSGSATYKFTGKPVSQTTGLYYDFQRWYDPALGRFVSPDPAGGTNAYNYALNNPLTYIDPDGAAPIDTRAERVFVGFYHSVTRSISVDSFVPPRWWGDWYVGGSSSHTIWSANRPDYPGIRSEDVLLGKLDRPNLLPSAKLDQRVFHFVSEDSHLPVSDTLGKFNEEFFDYGSKLSVSLLVPGALMSAWNVKSAFEQGGIESAVRVGVGEAAGWAGAWLGGELGAAVGTAVFPGVGTMIGGLTGAMLGGIFGQQGVDYLYQLVAGASWNNYWTDRPMAKRGPN